MDVAVGKDGANWSLLSAAESGRGDAVTSPEFCPIAGLNSTSGNGDGNAM